MGSYAVFGAAPPVLLAPMAGITDQPFRRAAVAQGARYVVSEMVAGEQLALENPNTVRRTARVDGAPLVIQLAGREAKWMSLGAKLAEDAGADVIDINMGCPAKQVTSGYSGSALMRDPDHALSLIEATVAATSKPVTLKMRLGWDRQSLTAPEIARRAVAAGISMLVIHGRTRQDFYANPADWAAIRPTVEAVSIPVIANGDIKSAEDARTAMKLSGAAGVMIGRAAQGRPWLPAAIQQALVHGGEVQAPDSAQAHDMLMSLYEDTLSFYGLRHGVRIARKHIAAAIETTLIHLDPETRRQARADICRMDDPQAVRAAIASLFAEQEGERLAA